MGKRIISIVLTMSILYGLCAAMNFAYFEEEDWCHSLWHSYYKTDNIDNLFLGSSHVYSDVNPELLDNINGMSNFNMSYGFQSLSESYYLIKEAARRHDLKNVYVELYHVPNTEKMNKNIENRWRAISYMRPSITKYQFVFEMGDSTHYLETLFPFVRYRSKLFDIEYVKTVIEKKNSEDWKNYAYNTNKGFLYSDKMYTQEKWLSDAPVNLIEDGMLSEENQNYMRKIMKYCQKKGINIKFFISPMYETLVLSAGDYDAYYKQVQSIANEYQVELYDFNLCKQQYLNVTQSEYLSDAGHLNTSGANIFTPLLWDVLAGDPAENVNYFYNSFQERIAEEEPETYGVYYTVEEDRKKCVIATNRNNYYEYRIIATPSEGESLLLQDFSYNIAFDLPHHESGILTIVSRDPAGNINTIEMDYYEGDQ